MSETARWGILGCAGIACKVCVAIAEASNAEVVAVGSRSLDKATKFVEDNAPGATPYSSYDAVLEDDKVNIVYIPLPTSMKKEWVLKAAERGKHVLCDKPIALNTAEANEMVQACADAKVQFMDNTMMMHHERLTEIKKVIGDVATFGKVKHVVSCFTIPFGNDEDWAKSNIRMDASTEPFGTLGDLGWYNIRISQWAFDYKEPEEVSCHYFDETSAGVPITAHAILKYSGGCTATFDTSFKCDLRQWAEVVGEKRTVRWDDMVVNQDKESALFTVVSGGIADKAITFPKTTHMEGKAESVQHTKLIENMSKFVSAPPDIQWSIISEQTQRIMMALHESARNKGQWTKCAPPTATVLSGGYKA